MVGKKTVSMATVVVMIRLGDRDVAASTVESSGKHSVAECPKPCKT